MQGGPDSLLVRLESGVWAEDPQARVLGVPSVSWRAVRNLESPSSLGAFFHAPGTLRLNRIDREQVPSQERKGGPRAWGRG